MSRKMVWTLIIALVLIPVLIWVGSLIRCEILTQVYYEDFALAYQKEPWIGEDIEYFKVLNCDGETAEVYYVGKDMDLGSVMTLQKVDGVWVKTYWDCVWSDKGSASGVIYPYWWHFIYGGV